MKDNFNVNFDEVSKFYSKLEKLLLLQIRRFFGKPAEVKHKPTAAAAEGTTGAGSITAAAPRPPNKKSIVILKGIDSKKALFHGESLNNQLFFQEVKRNERNKKRNMPE